MTNRALQLLLITICFLAVSLSAAAAKPLRVGTWKTAQTIQPFFYASVLPEPQKITVSAFTNPADQKTALLAGSLDMTGTTIAHAIHSAAQGQPVVLVAALCNKCSALVTHTSGNITTIADLKGKNIGYVPGTMHEILLREALHRAGLSPEKDVHLTRVDFFDMGLALARNDIAAFLSGEPFPTLAVSKGYGRIMAYPYYDDSVGTINAGMLVTRKTIENNPEMVSLLVKAHAEATQYLTNHKAAWLNKASEFGTPLAILQQAADNMELAWNLDEAFVSRTKALGKRMQELGVISRQPDYDQLFDLSFVTRVREEKRPDASEMVAQ